MRVRVLLAGAVAVAGASAGASLAAGRAPSADPDPAPPLRLGVVHAGHDPRTIDLASVVPRGGTLDHVWFVPAGSGRPQLVVAWQRQPGQGSRRWGMEEGRHWQLTLWNPQGADHGSVRWVPHVLVAASPFPIADWFRTVRRAARRRHG